jgi:hypothetical protein
MRMRILAALALLMTGCSFALVTRAKDATADRPCTQSNAAPIVDTTIAVAAIASGLAIVFSDPHLPFDNGDHTMQGMGGMVALEGLMFGAGAVYGFGSTSTCRRPSPG